MKFELSLWKVEKSGLLKYCIYVGLVDFVAGHFPGCRPVGF